MLTLSLEVIKRLDSLSNPTKEERPMPIRVSESNKSEALNPSDIMNLLDMHT